MVLNRKDVPNNRGQGANVLSAQIERLMAGCWIRSDTGLLGTCVDEKGSEPPWGGGCSKEVSQSVWCQTRTKV